MNKYFYPIWLPASVLAHVVVLVLLQFMPLGATQIPPFSGDNVSRVKVIPSASEPLKPQDPPQIKPNIVLPKKMEQPLVKPDMPKAPSVKTHGVSNPPKWSNNSGYTGLSNKGKPKGDNGVIGKAKRSGWAPSTTNGNHPTAVVPTGNPKGYDSGGDDPEPAGPHDAGGQTEGATAENIVSGSYPKDALNNGEEGTIVISVSISASGRASGAEVSSNDTGSSLLANAAKRAANRSTFHPATRDNQPVATSATITYTYKNGRVSAHVNFD